MLKIANNVTYTIGDVYRLIFDPVLLLIMAILLLAYY